jgi:hypothetical protein
MLQVMAELQRVREKIKQDYGIRAATIIESIVKLAVFGMFLEGCAIGIALIFPGSLFDTTLLDTVGLIGMQCIFGFIAFSLGIFLYAFRCRFLNTYGFFEVLIGCLGAVFLISLAHGQIRSGDLNFWFAVLGTFYIMVRGYDNIYKSLSSTDRQSWNRTFFGKDTEEKLA